MSSAFPPAAHNLPELLQSLFEHLGEINWITFA
jgi:hypothetical protein